MGIGIGRVRVHILNLSDYHLLEIFQYVESTDLWHLSRTCQRFRELVEAKHLWHKIEARDYPNSPEKIAFCLKRINETTEDIRLCSEGRHLQIISNDFVKRLPCTNLTILALENQKIEGHNIKLSEFPESLVELSLKKTFVIFPDEFLKDSHNQLQNLKVLILDLCFWVKAHMLQELGMYSSLEILSLYKCKGVDDVDVPIVSGFQQLRILDCRFSGLGNRLFRLVAEKKDFQIYFQSYLTTYFAEKAERELIIAAGSAPKKYSYISELDDIPLWSKDIVKYHFGNKYNTAYIHLDTPSDDGAFIYYFGTEKENTTTSYCLNSTLYEKPYRECTCNKNSIMPLYHLKAKGLYGKIKELKGNASSKGKVSTIHNLPHAARGYEVVQRLRGITVDNMFQTNNPDFTRMAMYNTRSEHVVMLEHLADDILDAEYRSRYSPRLRRWYRHFPDVLDTVRTHGIGLQKLSLRGCKGITDLTLRYLQHLNLTLLDVTFTNVTSEGLERFVLMNPQCRLLHESMCTCRPQLHF